ncbi:trypsin-like peptidase domain-containing protein [Geopsychrobacter electrodiphilus]|uniref:trypsin-like peptidase domain-containing protein n=1 Tax=Geopsychrobacter electrodiphilus TaxID=225196 RepID=UPI000361CC80|nr:trypsin-like peptidase domain-containing protein [Geopsychrobacter electrodiphilus]
MTSIRTSIFALLWLLLLLVTAGQAAERETPVVKAVALARRAVVNIRTEQVQRRNDTPFGFGDSFFEQFFRDQLPPSTMTKQSLGSGVIIDARGHVLTNAHVVAKASKIYVALPDHSDEMEAQLVGIDERLDLAVLQISGKGDWPYLRPARSDDLMLGETVIAIGNPLGLGHSITTGVISSVARRIELEKGFSSVFIQSDALINPGNSGGPLININGELIGINTAIARQAQGIGFSIPADVIKRVLKELIDYGQVRPVYLGIIPGEVGDSFMPQDGNRGVLLVDFLEKSPAKVGGLHVADVIQSVNGISLSDIDELNAQLATYPPGSRVTLGVLRGLNRLSCEVTLAPLSDDYLMAYTRQVFGLGFQLGREEMLITSVEAKSAASHAGIEPGDRIVEIAHRKVGDPDNFRHLMASLIGREPLTFLVVRDNRGYLLQLPQ